MSSKDQNAKRQVIGEKLVPIILRDHKYKNIRKRKKGEKGFDLVATKEKRKLKIEVKTSAREKGIPDMFETEFKRKNNKWFFVADLLCILRVDETNKPIKLEILTKSQVNKYAHLHRPVVHIKVSSKLKTDLRNKKIGNILWRKIIK